MHAHRRVCFGRLRIVARWPCCTVAIVALSALGVEERTGRAGGFDERNDPKDKKHYDSDEEEYDDFGRKKKKKKRG
jgi:hypothetical protein